MGFPRHTRLLQSINFLTCSSSWVHHLAWATTRWLLWQNGKFSRIQTGIDCTKYEHPSLDYSQVNYAVDCIRKMMRKNLKSINVKAERAVEFSNTLDQELLSTVWSRNCMSWYQNAMGKVNYPIMRCTVLQTKI
jgi:hypothetical protein